MSGIGTFVMNCDFYIIYAICQGKSQQNKPSRDYPTHRASRSKCADTVMSACSIAPECLGLLQKSNSCALHAFLTH